MQLVLWRRGKLFSPQQGVPSYYREGEEVQADQETKQVFREQTEGSPDVSRQAEMSLRRREVNRLSVSFVYLPSSQRDIKYSISTPPLHRR